MQKRKRSAADINRWNFSKKLVEKFATNFLGNSASSFPVLVVLLHQPHQQISELRGICEAQDVRLTVWNIVILLQTDRTFIRNQIWVLTGWSGNETRNG